MPNRQRVARMADTQSWPWSIRGSGTGGWWIDAGDGQPVGGKHYTCHHIAESRAHRLENAARLAPRLKDRACMNCDKTFTSTGACAIPAARWPDARLTTV